MNDKHQFIPCTDEDFKHPLVRRFLKLLEDLPDDLLIGECIRRGYFTPKDADRILTELGQEP